MLNHRMITSATDSFNFNSIKNIALLIWMNDVRMHANTEKSGLFKTKLILPSKYGVIRSMVDYLIIEENLPFE